MSMTAGAVWKIAYERFKRLDSDNNYAQLGEAMLPLRLDGSTLVLGAPDAYFGEWLKFSCGDLIDRALLQIEGVDYTYSIEVVPAKKANLKAAAVSAEEPVNDEFEQLELFALEEDAAEEETIPAAAVPVIPAVPVSPVSAAAVMTEKSAPAAGSVNARGDFNDPTFENFIVSDDNNAAYRAALAVSVEPGMLYNPLFIHGTNGIGKTHLLQSIASKIAHDHPQRVVKCIPCSDLVNDFYRILTERRSTAEFRDNLLEADVLLIDDVHGLAKKVQMQEDFFSVFNTLIGRRTQIVMTCDRPPSQMADIDKRLTTRFEAGVICEVCMPEYEARMLILRMWQNNILSSTRLPDDVLEFLATNIRSSVRRLRSAFLTLSFCASLSGKSDFSVAEAEEQLHAQIAEEVAIRSISIEDIQHAVSEFYNLTIADLLGSKRTKNIAEPRMVAMALARELTKESSTAVGNAFGRNHATILHAEKQVELLCAKDDAMRCAIAQIKRKLQK